MILFNPKNFLVLKSSIFYNGTLNVVQSLRIETFQTITFSPAMIQSDSVSTALESFKQRSSIRATSVARGDDLPTSNAGEAMGESSTLKNRSPSVGRWGRGLTTSQDTLANTLIMSKFFRTASKLVMLAHLVFPSVTSTLPGWWGEAVSARVR
jgi:hypothetical protein